MPYIIQLKRGLRRDLPTTAAPGEPLFCLDTAELFIGKDDGSVVCVGRMTNHAGSTPPTDYRLGDFWYNPATGEIRQWNGTTWELTSNISHTYFQPTAPASGMQDGDIWLDSDDSNHLYRYDGAQAKWISARDTAIEAAAADNIINRKEKANIKREWGNIVEEAQALTGIITAQAEAFGVSHTTFDTAYQALDQYLNSPAPNGIQLFASMSTDTTIDRATWDSKWTAYFSERTRLLKAISDKAKAAGDTAQGSANQALTNAANAAAEADAAITAANAAQATATAAKAYTDELASDSKITSSEKPGLKQKWDIVVAEANPASGSIPFHADSIGVTHAAFDAAYLALSNYLTLAPPDGIQVFASMNTTTTLVRATWDSKWKTYYSERTALLNAIAAAAKSKADTAFNQASAATTQAYNAQTTANAAKAYTDELAADNKITSSEKPSLKQKWDIIVEEATATTGTIPAQAIAFGVSHSAFDTAYSALNAYLTSTLNVFGSMTTTTTLDSRSNWDSKWKAYYSERTKLLKAIADQAKAVADAAQTTASAKIQTFTQTTEPTPSTIGDLWYNPSTKILKSWDGSAWQIAGNAFSDTSDLTDTQQLLLGSVLAKTVTLDTNGKFKSANGNVARFEITQNYIVGFAADGVTQEFLLRASDGKAVAGGGDVTLDSQGVTIVAPDDPYVGRNSVKWKAPNGSTLGEVFAYNLDNFTQTVLSNNAVLSGGVKDSGVLIQCTGSNFKSGKITLFAASNGGPSGIVTLTAPPSGAPTLAIASNILTTMGALSVTSLTTSSTALVANLNADKLDGYDAGAFALLGHNHDTAYLGINAKAADSDTLDGYHQDAFARMDAFNVFSVQQQFSGNVRMNDQGTLGTARALRVKDGWIQAITAPGNVEGGYISSASIQFAGLNADLLDGKHASDFLLATAQAADSAKLGGVAASSYSQTSHTHSSAAAGFQLLAQDTNSGEGGELWLAGSLGHTDLGIIDRYLDSIRISVGWGKILQIPKTGNLAWGSETVWTSGNHGAGSGLNADLLDGLEAAQFFQQGVGGTMPWLELRWAGSTPFIDFSNDAGSDFDVRLCLTSDDTLDVQGGTLTVAGSPVWHSGNFNPGIYARTDIAPTFAQGLISSGYVGLNATTPDVVNWSMLDVRKDQGYAGITSTSYGDNATIGGIIGMFKARGSMASKTAVMKDDRLGNLVVGGYTGPTNGWLSSAAMSFKADGTISDGYLPQRIALEVGSTGARSDILIADLTGVSIATAGTSLQFGSRIGQHINLYQTAGRGMANGEFGIGIQNSTLYMRTASKFIVWQGGTHQSNNTDPGNGYELFYADGSALRWMGNTIYHSGNLNLSGYLTTSSGKAYDSARLGGDLAGFFVRDFTGTISVLDSCLGIPKTGTGLSFGARTGQHITLFSNAGLVPYGEFGIGVQAATWYARTWSHFAFYVGGTHSDSELNAGGGTNAFWFDTGSIQWMGHNLWHDGNFNPASYYPVSGGTLTGANINRDNDGSWLFVSGGTSNTAGASIQMYGINSSGATGRLYLNCGGAAATGSIFYRHYNGSSFVNLGAIDPNANFTIGGILFPNGTNTFAVKTGTAPTASLTDNFLMYSADQVAGNACPNFRTENGSVIKLFKGAALTAVNNGTIGATYTATEQAIIGNMRSRINDLEARLQALGLL